MTVQTEAGTFLVSTSPDDSVVQEMVDALRAKYNVVASDPQQVLTLQANEWIAELNQLVTAHRTANVVPLKLIMA